MTEPELLCFNQALGIKKKYKAGNLGRRWESVTLSEIFTFNIFFSL